MTKQARIVVCDRKLLPHLPSIIVEIDERLYIDIDSAASTLESFSMPGTWKDFIFITKWFWYYNQYDSKKYYAPDLGTVLVEWSLSHGVNLNLGIKAAWEETADEVFSAAMGTPARFFVDYGTHAVAQVAYLNSNFDITQRNEEEMREKYGTLCFEDILSRQLATTPVIEAMEDTKTLIYKLYDLYRKVTEPLRKVFQRY